jgi:hypothetical protein
MKTVEAMSEMGVDIKHVVPEKLTDDLAADASTCGPRP